MERILTNYQVEWLSNLNLLREYEDNYYRKDKVTEKTCNFIENNYPGEEEKIMQEFEVLKQKGFINFETSVNIFGSTVIDNIEINKLGLDYLVILEKDFKEKATYDENISKIYEILCTITKNCEKLNKNCEKLNEKSLLDKIEQFAQITSGSYSSVLALGSIAQGVIPMACKILKIY
ncbi:hypothetical protein [Clostridium sp. DL1XJH146]